MTCLDIDTDIRAEQGVVRVPGALIADISGAREAGTGSDWFPDVFDRGVFVDKSLLVKDVLQGYQVKLFCRPRRFGKTLGATMLKDFFECAPLADRHAPARFERLAIWDEDGGRWREHQGRYPVIMLPLKGAQADTWEKTRAALADLVAKEYARHRYVLDDQTLAPSDRAQFERLMDRTDMGADLLGSLELLCRLLATHHGERCMVIIDEYDAPIVCAHEHDFYQPAIAFMRSWLSGALKTNPHLARGVLTGVQRISKESIFSGLNNIDVSTSLNQLADERFGFTRVETQTLAGYLGRADRVDEMRAWYDGYRFGDADIYNPWSVLAYLAKGCVAQPYWVNTSSNSVLGQVLSHASSGVFDSVVRLLEPGVTLRRAIDPGVAYGELETNPLAAWSVLYMAGYLTTDDTARPEDPSVVRCLRVPNAEVRSVFRREVVERAQRAVADFERLAHLHDAIITGDAAEVERELSAIAMNSASVYDLTNEGACHMLLMGLLFGLPGYCDPVSNREAGYGRFDVQVVPRELEGDASVRSRVGSPLPLITFEMKYLPLAEYRAAGEKGPARLRGLARAALAQIDRNAYDAASQRVPRTYPCLRWGVAFSGKHVAIELARL